MEERLTIHVIAPMTRNTVPMIHSSLGETRCVPRSCASASVDLLVTGSGWPVGAMWLSVIAVETPQNRVGTERKRTVPRTQSHVRSQGRRPPGHRPGPSAGWLVTTGMDQI